MRQQKKSESRRTTSLTSPNQSRKISDAPGETDSVNIDRRAERVIQDSYEQSYTSNPQSDVEKQSRETEEETLLVADYAQVYSLWVPVASQMAVKLKWWSCKYIYVRRCETMLWKK